MINYLKDNTNAPHLYVAGKTGSGKSYLLFNQILTKHMKHEFDDIYLFTTTFESNKQYYDLLHLEDALEKKRKKEIYYDILKGNYDEFLLKSVYKKYFNQYTDISEQIKKLDKVKLEILLNGMNELVPYSTDDKPHRRIWKTWDDDAEKQLNHLFDLKLLHPNERWMVIFDDCTFDRDFVKSVGLTKLLRNGRSRQLFGVVLSQKFVDIPPRLRSQFGSFIIFHNAMLIEQEAVYNCCGVGSKSHFINKFFGYFDKQPKYSFSFIINSCDNLIYFNYDTTPFKITYEPYSDSNGKQSVDPE